MTKHEADTVLRMFQESLDCRRSELSERFAPFRFAVLGMVEPKQTAFEKWFATTNGSPRYPEVFAAGRASIDAETIKAAAFAVAAKEDLSWTDTADGGWILEHRLSSWIAGRLVGELRKMECP